MGRLYVYLHLVDLYGKYRQYICIYHTLILWVYYYQSYGNKKHYITGWWFPTHLTKISQIGSFPQGSGWKLKTKLNPTTWDKNKKFKKKMIPSQKSKIKRDMKGYLNSIRDLPKIFPEVIQSDLLRMVKWPFQGVKWPPTRGWKGHFESPGLYLLDQTNIEAGPTTDQFPRCEIYGFLTSSPCNHARSSVATIPCVGAVGAGIAVGGSGVTAGVFYLVYGSRKTWGFPKMLAFPNNHGFSY